MGKPTSHLQAIGFALVGFTLWVLVDTCMKLSGEASIPPYEIVGIIALIQASIMTLIVLRQGGVKKLWPKHPRQQLCRASLGLVTMVCNAFALRHLPLTTFYVIVFSAPMITALLAALLLHERIGWKEILAITIGFAGVVYAINPAAAISSGDWMGYAAVTVGTITFAGNLVFLRATTQKENLLSLAWFAGMFIFIACLIPTLLHFQAIGPRMLIILVAAGAFEAFGSLANFKALRHTTAATVSQFHYTQIIVGAIIGDLVWRDLPSIRIVTGAIIIIASGLYIAALARRTDKKSAIHF